MIDAAEFEFGIAVVRLDHPRAPVRRHDDWLVPWRRSESEPNIRFRSIPEQRRSRDRGDPSHDEGGPSVSTVSDKPTSDKPTSDKPTYRPADPSGVPTDSRSPATRTAIDAAARTVIAHQGHSSPPPLPTSPPTRAAQRHRFTTTTTPRKRWSASGALRFRDEVGERGRSWLPGTTMPTRERTHQAAAAHWHAYKHRLPEMISMLAIGDDQRRLRAQSYWADICAIPTSFITEMVRRAQADGCCAGDDPAADRGGDRGDAEPVLLPAGLAGPASRQDDRPDDEACIATLTNVFYRAIYSKEGC